MARKLHQGEEDSPGDAVFDITLKRLKEFSFYLIENVEGNLNHCLDLLEERTVTKKSNTLPTTAAGVISSAIPMVGKGVSAALKEGEIFILNRIDKKNSRLLSSLVYYFSDNRETIRRTLIQAAVDLFYCFEHQFSKLTCEGGEKRAMQKLAKDATNRIFTHFFENPPEEGEITKNDLTKAVILGQSIKSNVKIEKGRTLIVDEEKWTTLEIYTKVGLYLASSKEYFKTETTDTEKFGFRRTFDWESLDDTWIIDNSENEAFNFQLTKENIGNLQEDVRVYVISKNTAEEAKLDRELKHEIAKDDRSTKHQHILQRMNDMMNELHIYYRDLLNKQEENTKIVETVKKGNENKLEKIHHDVMVSQVEQAQIQQTAEEIKQKIADIENAQEEYLNAAAVIDKEQVGDVVRELNEMKNVMRAIGDCKNIIEKTKKIEDKSNKEVNRIKEQVRDVVSTVKEAKLDQKIKKNIDDCAKAIKNTKLDKKIKKLF